MKNSSAVRLFLVLAALGTGITILFLYAPGNSIYPPCLFHKYTGLYCTGCGATRAVHALVHGRFLSAARFNILFVVLAPWLLYRSVQMIVNWISCRPAPIPTPRSKLTWITVVIILLFTVLRNVPYYPFTLLAPARF